MAVESTDTYLSLMRQFEDEVSLPPKQPTRHRGPWTVILTGSTGYIGIYILAAMQARPTTNIRKIYCLNRAADARERHIKALKARNLPDLDDERVAFLQASFGESRFRVDDATYDRLRDEVTLIIHNAWPVNFRMAIAEFAPHIKGVRNFLHFSYNSPLNPPVLFVSSIGTSQNACPDIMEAIHARPTLVVVQGYSRAKYISERLVDRYVRTTGLPAAILRVGLVAGPVDSGGTWPPQFWFPTLVRASLYLGVLPADLGLLDSVTWLPVDVVVRIMIELAEDVVVSSTIHRARVYNVCNPTPVSFSAILPALGGIANRTVPLSEWAALLSSAKAQCAAAERDKIPGWKLADFYQNILATTVPPSKIRTGNLTAASRTARNLPSVNCAWMEKWLEQWKLPTASSTPKPRL